MASRNKPRATPLWTQVTASPETINNPVFNKGYSATVIIVKPNGGQTPPIKIDGLADEWKKAQKNPKKSIISEAINSKNPLFKPNLTTCVWCPKKVPSLIIAVNQKKAAIINIKIPKRNNQPPYIILCI